MVQKFCGNIPSTDAFFPPQSIGFLEGAEWFLAVGRTQFAGWRNIKVFANAPVPRKANYRSGWNGERLARHRDISIMSKNRPELLAMLMASLNDMPMPAPDAPEIDGDGSPVRQEGVGAIAGHPNAPDASTGDFLGVAA